MEQERIHEEILQDAIHDAQKNPEPRNPHKIWIPLAIAAALLLSITFVGGGAIQEFIAGRFLSSTISEDYNIKLDSQHSIQLSQATYDGLIMLWYAYPTEEFAVCLIGKKQGSTYVVNDIYVPTLYSQEVNSVSYQRCSAETIITLHSHPPDRCIQSAQDQRTHRALKDDNTEAITGLMCGPGRFTFLLD